MVDKHVLREWLVISCIILHQMGIGMVLAYPSILTRALTNENSTDIRATQDQTSWITTAYPISGPLSFIMMPALMQLYGRRFIHISLILCTLIGNVVIATAPNVPALISGRVIQGLAFSNLYLTTVLVAEYSHPKRRGFFTTLKAAGGGLGNLICHGFGSFLTWRQMAWLATIPTILSAAGTLLFPESPSWLVYKGRFEESVKSFEWLRGTNTEARMEIKELIEAQSIRLKSSRKDGHRKMLLSKGFLKPLAIEIVISILAQACGRYYVLAYLMQIMVQLTGNDVSKAYYYMLGFDTITIIGVILSTFVVVKFRRKVLLFTAGTMGCFILTSVCIVNYLNAIGVLDLQWLAPLLLTLFNFVNYAGVLPLTFVIKGEIVPLEFKGLTICLSGVLYSSFAIATLKLTSTMLVAFGTHGTLAIYVVIAALCLLFLCFTLPETKDRTLQDIETEFITRRRTDLLTITNEETELKELRPREK